ncbi:MAG: divalent-cation tolerance protein CutA [Candidatus Bathyarchaeota archaeon]|nr:divalent-cation tolerance protein CutA [Candidatus Bathyarchaeota archaeon]
MGEYIQVITTFGNKEEAEKISQIVVEKRLAGCAQVIGPITSIYWWKGKIERAEEWLCLIKSQADLYQELESTILQVHSYENPEILAMPIIRGSKSYLSWLESELKK